MARAGKGPSIRMVADAANVSVATVSNVINGKTSVAPAISARVQAAVERLGYVRDHRAARLRSGESRLAGVIVPDLTNPMFAAFVSTLEHLARCDGYDLVVVSARNDPAEEAERLRHIRGWRPAGLIVIPCDGALDARLPEGLDHAGGGRGPHSGGRPLRPRRRRQRGGLRRRSCGISTCRATGTAWWSGPASASATCSSAGRGRCPAAARHPARPPRGRLRRPRARPRSPSGWAGEPRPEALFCLDHETTLAAYQLLGELGLAAGARHRLRELRRDGVDAAGDAGALRGAPAGRGDGRMRLEAAGAPRIGGEAGAPQSRRLRCAVTFRGSTPRQAARNAN